MNAKEKEATLKQYPAQIKNELAAAQALVKGLAAVEK